MMTEAEIVSLIQAEIPQATVDVLDKTGVKEHFIIRVVSKRFEGVNLLDRHRMVMGCLSAALNEGRLHAAEIQTAVS